MNFEFMNGLCGFGKIYEDCIKAEQLSNSMPAQSISLSRKCAEEIAKFIYLSAHKELINTMSFLDILKVTELISYIYQIEKYWIHFIMIEFLEMNPHLNCLHRMSDFYGFHSIDDFMIAIIKEFDDGIHWYGVMF